jgi:hypothetical protein
MQSPTAAPRARLVRRATRWSAALLLAVFAPALRAQDAAAPPAEPPPPPAEQPGTHVVREGDTLWEIARLYLNDPFLWPEIYRINTDVVEDPHWIYPGESLRLPGATTVVAAVPTAIPSTPADPTQPPPAAEEVLPAAVATGPTLFSRSPLRRGTGTGTGRRELIGAAPHPTVRAGEFHAAPFADRSGGPRGAGRIVQTSEILGVKSTGESSPLMLYEKIYVRPPREAEGRVGERFLVFTLGSEVTGVGQIVIPTGIVEVERVGDDEATTARIVQQFGEIQLGQGLIPLERFDLPADARAMPLEEGGTEAKVVWIQDRPVLASVQRYLVLDPRGENEVRIGDRFTLVRPRTRAPSGDRVPEQVIAEAQVVKVTERGATAIVIGQTQPAIRIGTPARVTAKMP